MGRVVHFHFAGEPLPKPRPRVSKRGGVFVPEAYAAFEEELRWSFRAAFGGKPFRTPVRVDARFYRSSRRACDGDNLLKSLLDAGNQIGWSDDSLVRHVNYRVDVAEAAGIDVWVREDHGEWP